MSSEDAPRFYAILRAFQKKTGIPILLNTSLNVMGEPIVESPEQALACLLFTGLDVMVLEDRIFAKKGSFRSILDLHPKINIASLQLTIPIEGDRVEVAVDGDASVEVRARSRWGTPAYSIGNGDVVLLEAIDGQKSGHELLDMLQAEHDVDVFNEEDLKKRLMRLTRYGIIRLEARQAPTPSTASE